MTSGRLAVCCLMEPTRRWVGSFCQYRRSASVWPIKEQQLHWRYRSAISFDFAKINGSKTKTKVRSHQGTKEYQKTRKARVPLGDLGVSVVGSLVFCAFSGNLLLGYPPENKYRARYQSSMIRAISGSAGINRPENWASSVATNSAATETGR